MILRNCVFFLLLSLSVFAQKKSKSDIIRDFIDCKYVQSGCDNIQLSSTYSSDSLIEIYFFKLGSYGTLIYFDIQDSIIVGYQDLERGIPNGLSITRNDSQLISTMMFNPMDSNGREYEYREYYPSGILKETGKSYLGGSFKIGRWNFYNEKGIIHKELNYVVNTTSEGYLESVLDGIQKYYCEGVLESKEYYENGSMIKSEKIDSTREE